MRRWLFFLVVLVVLAVPAWCAEAAEGKTLEAVRPKREDLIRRTKLPGSIEPWEQAVLYARATGYLKEIRVDRGDAVKAGDVIAVLEIPEMAGDLQKVKAELSAMEAETRLQSVLAEYQKGAQARDPGAVSRQEIEMSQAKATAADARRDAARAAVARLEALAALAEVKAPFDGVVAERKISPGALVSAGATMIALLVQSDRLRVLVDIPDVEVRHLKVANAAKVSIASLGLSVEGKVGRVSGRLDGATRTQRIEVDLDNKEGRITPGLYADVVLDLEMHPQAVVIPAGAVLKKSVMVLVPEGSAYVARKRDVKAGVSDGIVTEILEGLSGDEILAANPNSVSDGEAVVGLKEKSW